MRLTRGGKLVLGIGLWLLAYWPGWVFGSLLAIVGTLLVGGEL